VTSCGKSVEGLRLEVGGLRMEAIERKSEKRFRGRVGGKR
jgi:hypothetical protein